MRIELPVADARHVRRLLQRDEMRKAAISDRLLKAGSTGMALYDAQRAADVAAERTRRFTLAFMAGYHATEGMVAAE